MLTYTRHEGLSCSVSCDPLESLLPAYEDRERSRPDHSAAVDAVADATAPAWIGAEHIMRVLVAIAQIPFYRRDTEALAEGLRRALISAGHSAEIVRIPYNWQPPERVLEHLLAFRLIDLEDREGLLGDALVALEFPAYLIRHTRSILWLAHHRRFAGFLGVGTGEPSRPGVTDSVDDTCRAIDQQFIPKAEKALSVSATVSLQLRKGTGIDTTPLYPPAPSAAEFYWEPAEDYLLVPPGALSRERLELLLKAMALTRAPARAVICRSTSLPVADTEQLLRERYSALEERLEWLDPDLVGEAQLLELYARCQAVLYPGRGESLPWVALNAMMASKPLITFPDSGAPAELVVHEETGLLPEAAPADFAAAMDELVGHPDRSRVWGTNGRELAESLNFTWQHVVDRLLA